MPKGRIGLSLSEDVLAILNKHGRSDGLPDDHRPTRTQIIEEAVRRWAIEKDSPSSVFFDERKLEATACPVCRRSVIPGRVSGGAKCTACDGTGKLLSELEARRGEPDKNEEEVANPNVTAERIRHFGAGWQQASDLPLEEREGFKQLMAEQKESLSEYDLSGIADRVEAERRAEKKAARPTKKEITAALARGENIQLGARPLERGKVAPIPKPGKKA